MLNLWHDLPAGQNPPEIVTAVIEIPSGSRNKYELDKATGMLKLDRVPVLRRALSRATTASSRARCTRTAIRSTCSCW